MQIPNTLLCASSKQPFNNRLERLEAAAMSKIFYKEIAKSYHILLYLWLSISLS